MIDINMDETLDFETSEIISVDQFVSREINYMASSNRIFESLYALANNEHVSNEQMIHIISNQYKNLQVKIKLLDRLHARLNSDGKEKKVTPANCKS